MSDDKVVSSTILRPFYDIDAEMDCAASIVRLIEGEFREILSDDELRRVTAMVADRYS